METTLKPPLQVNPITDKEIEAVLRQVGFAPDAKTIAIILERVRSHIKLEALVFIRDDSAKQLKIVAKEIRTSRSVAVPVGTV